MSEPELDRFRMSHALAISNDGAEHAACEFFVLDTDHDPFAIYALVAYAQFCEVEKPALARDLRALCLRKERERWVREDEERRLAAGLEKPEDEEPPEHDECLDEPCDVASEEPL